MKNKAIIAITILILGVAYFSPRTIETRNLAVILYKFPTDNDLGTTKLDFAKQIFDNGLISQPYSFKDFIEESSYGKVTITGKVSQWVTVSSTSTLQDIISAADSYFVYPNYDEIILIRPKETGSLGSGSGMLQTFQTDEGEIQVPLVSAHFKPSLGLPDYSRETIVEDGFVPFTGYHLLSHEFGHALIEGVTIGHEGMLFCTNSPLLLTGTNLNSSCSVAVGRTGQLGSGGGHYNSIIKERLGWFTESQVLEATQSGTYTLTGYSRPEGIKVIKVPRITCGTSDPSDPCGGDGEGWYYLEYRVDYGHDQALFYPTGGPNGDPYNYHGVEVRIDGYRPDFSGLLLRMNPAQFLNHTLLVGQTYTEPFNGYQIKTVSENGETAVVEIII